MLEYFKNYEGSYPELGMFWNWREDWLEIEVGAWPWVLDKCPVCLDHIDYQVCNKDADRLYIHGPNFEGVDVTIFTPANDYIECEGYVRCLDDPVWLGDVAFDYVALWGDFNIVNGKTVTFNEIELKCGNVRRIGTDRDIDDKDVCTDKAPEFVHRGTLTGGEITSDTKPGNVLVIGDGVKVYDVVLTEWLYNVILETVKLKDVSIEVGVRNPGIERWVCKDGHWESLAGYDVHVWRGNHAIFEGVTLVESKVRVPDLAMLTVVGELGYDAKSRVKVEKQGNFASDEDAFDASIVIRQEAGRAYVDYKVEAVDPWLFNDWKPDIWIEADMGSEKYEFIIGSDRYIVDLRDPDFPELNYEPHPNEMVMRDGELVKMSVKQGVWLTELLNIDRETLATQIGEAGLSFRIAADGDKDFTLTVTGYVFNCCGCNHEVASDSADVELKDKDIQKDSFGIKFDKDLEVDTNATSTVGFTVTNTGNTTSELEYVRLFVNNVMVDQVTFDPAVVLAPGGSYTVGKDEAMALTYEAPDEPGNITLRLETNFGGIATQQVRVVGEAYFEVELQEISGYSNQFQAISNGKTVDAGWEAGYEARYTITNTGNEPDTQEITFRRRDTDTDPMEPFVTVRPPQEVTLEPGDSITVLVKEDYSDEGTLPDFVSTRVRVDSADDFAVNNFSFLPTSFIE